MQRVAAASALLVMVAYASVIFRRRWLAAVPRILSKVITPPSALAARAAAEGWPDKALEPYIRLMTLSDAPPSMRGGVPASHVSVSFGAQNDRLAYPGDVDEIEAVWTRRLAAAQASGGKLFDMSKFRLRRIHWADRRREHLCIELGLTSYREYIGTNQLPDDRRAALEAAGTSACGDAAGHLSNALGCETMLVTSDGMAVLLRRSAKVAGGVGLYNGPSGHPEPSHANAEWAARASDASAAASHKVLCARVRDELFGSILQEVHEETNVPMSALSEPRIIGAMSDSAHKPDLLFVTTTTLDAAGVRTAYAAGAAEGWESDKLAFWPAARLAECACGPEAMPLTSVTRAAVECFELLG